MNISYSSKAFFYAQGVTIVGEMLAPPLGAFLMRTSLWMPIIIGFVCLILAVVLTVVMPETRFTALAMGPQDDGPAHDGTGSSESEELLDSKASKADFGLKGRLKAAVEHTSSTVGFVLKHRNLVLLMAVFFSTDFAQQSLTVLLRYASSRYSIPLGEVCTRFLTFLSAVCLGSLIGHNHDAYSRTGRSISRPAIYSPSRPSDKCWHMASSFPSSTPHWSVDADSCLASRISTFPG